MDSEQQPQQQQQLQSPARRQVSPRVPTDSTARSVAVGLGWFSVVLGAAELLLPRTLGRSTGLRSRQGLLRMYGLREIGVGAGLLGAADKTPWLWGRVAGDALDLATLVLHLDRRNIHRGRTLTAIVAVAGVTALDVVTARAVAKEPTAADPPTFDYGDRIGMASSPVEMRGAALSTFEMPADMQNAERRIPLGEAAMSS